MQISIACKINAIITRYCHRNTVTKKQQGREILFLVALQIYLGRLYLTLIAITFSCRCIRQKL